MEGKEEVLEARTGHHWVERDVGAAKLDLFSSTTPVSSTGQTAGAKCLFNGPQVGMKDFRSS